MLGSPQARWFLERLTGIASGRKLPKVAKTTFLRMAQKMRLTHSERGSQRKVAYFVDVYANWFDTELAQATVAVLRHNGFSVFVPPRQLPAGMPLVASGTIDAARAQARKNVAYLAEIIRQGYTIVTSEPSAALCLTHEYRYLLPDEDEAQLVAEHTCDVGSLLWKEHLQGRLQLDFKPRAMKLVYHLPCHLKALPDHAPGLNLLKLIPGLNIQMAQRGCSGMAGMFGIKRQNYRTSLRIGWDLIDAVRDPTVHGATTECSTCKLQMEQGGDKPTVHPMKILASAYGILRSDTDPLDRHSQPLVVS